MNLLTYATMSEKTRRLVVLSALVKLAKDAAFSEADHPRGQPQNAGQFASVGTKKENAKPAAQKSASAVTPPSSDADMGRFIAEVKETAEYKAVEKHLEALQNETKSGNVQRWSIEKNTDAAGNYTPQRQALHDAIVAKVLTEDTKAKAGERPKAVLLLGPPGAGKTTAGGPIARQMVGEDTHLATLNADDVKSELPEYKGYNAAAVHEESSDLVEGRMVPEGIKGRHNLLFDFTGNNELKMAKIADMLHGQGYDVHVIDVTVPTHVAVSRAWSRFVKSGRFVPPEYIKGVDGNPDRTYAKLKTSKSVRSWAQVDNHMTRTVTQGSNDGP